MKNIPLLLLISMVTFCTIDAKAQQPAGCLSEITYYDYGHKYVHERYYVYSTNLDVMQGEYKEYSQLGILLKDGSYNKGIKVGRWTYRYESNVLYCVETFDADGKYDGEVEWFTTDPRDPTKMVPSSDYHYKHGQRDGTCKDWVIADDGHAYVPQETDVYRDGDVVRGTKFFYYGNGILNYTAERHDSAGLVLVHFVKNYSDGHRSAEYTELVYRYDFYYDRVGDNDYLGNEGTQTQWYDTTGVVALREFFDPDRQSGTYQTFDRHGKEIGKGTMSFQNGTYVTVEQQKREDSLAEISRKQAEIQRKREDSLAEISRKQAEIQKKRIDSLAEIYRKQAEIQQKREDSLAEISRKQAEIQQKIKMKSDTIDLLYQKFKGLYVGRKQSTLLGVQLVNTQTQQPIYTTTYPNGEYLYMKSDTLIKYMYKDCNNTSDIGSHINKCNDIIGLLNKLISYSATDLNGKKQTDTKALDKEMKKAETMDDIKRILGL